MINKKTPATRRFLFAATTAIILCTSPAEAWYWQRVDCVTGDPIDDVVKKAPRHRVAHHTHKRYVGLRKMSRRHNNYHLLHRRHCHKLKCYVRTDDNGFGGGGWYEGDFFTPNTDDLNFSGGAFESFGGGRARWYVPRHALHYWPQKHHLQPSVPEASTWLMMLTGFAGLALLVRTRKQKTM